jgi:glycolate dehydrogenase FAD-binding subunit
MPESTCTIDGVGPMPIVRPRSVDELGALIREFSTIFPVGGQTKTALGSPPVKSGRAVDIRGLAQVIDFPARDMTITVQSGITIAALRHIIHAEKLDLPIDVAQAASATLGGILATNSSGSRRYGYGTLRDYVIGISALNDEGREFKAGGRVVKNVAGYDLCKLLVGSLGTLGIITQVTLKLRPLPEVKAILGLECDSSKLDCVLKCMRESRTRPTCIDLLNQAAANAVFTQALLAPQSSPWLVLIGYEGNLTAVDWQVQQLVKETGAQCQIAARIDYTAEPLCEALISFQAANAVTFKASLLPSATAAFCLAADEAMIHAHAGNGVVRGHWGGDLTKDRAASILTTWREHAAKGQGSVIVERCPSEWKSTLNVWGPPRGDSWLMREIKKKFDPRGIFNPGRFVDGI